MSKNKITPKRAVILAMITLIIFAIYFTAVPMRHLNTLTAQIELIFIAALIMIAVGMFIFFLVKMIRYLLSKNRSTKKFRLGDQMIYFFVVIFILVSFVLGSQFAAHTPPIIGEDGGTLKNSIASLEKVELGGVDQWLMIRGQDVNKPVMLFLSGGPGASEAARVLRFNQDLEKDFVVVIWEQRGCGKSYPSINPKSALTIDQYTSDIIELTDMLRERFNEEKIYLVGHSWGTIIGVRAIQSRPDLFHAYVGTAQMVNVRETDKIIYDMVMAHSKKTGDTKFVQTLENQGPPPYYGRSPIQPYATLFGREYAIYEFPNIKNEAYRRDGDILQLMLKQPEYGWLDRIYYLLGLMNTFNVVYPQLQDVDLRDDATQLEVPVYIILGRHDMNNPSQLPEDYFNRLEAPSKQLIFFEDSGHGMIWEEAGLFHSILTDTVLEETYP